MDEPIFPGIEEELRDFRARLRPQDEASYQAFLDTERRRQSRPLVEYTEAHTENRAFARLLPEEDDASVAPFSPPPEESFCDVLFTLDLLSGGSGEDGYDTAGAAYDAATDSTSLSRPYDHGKPAYLGDLTGALAQTDIQYHPPADAPYYTADAQQSDLTFNLATSTGFLKIYYDVEVSISTGPTDSGPYSVQSTTPKTYEYTGGPVGTEGDTSTYYDAPKYTTTFAEARPADPAAGGDRINGSYKRIMVKNVRWSAVAGYVPPVDGSANGFPPSA